MLRLLEPNVAIPLIGLLSNLVRAPNGWLAARRDVGVKRLGELDWPRPPDFSVSRISMLWCTAPVGHIFCDKISLRGKPRGLHTARA